MLNLLLKNLEVSSIDRVHDGEDGDLFWIEINYEDTTDSVMTIQITLNSEQYETQKSKLNPNNQPIRDRYYDPATQITTYR